MSIDIRYVIKQQEKAVEFLLWKCCLNCIRWDKDHNICSLAKEQPPLKVIVAGCNSYEEDIPF